MELSFNGQMDYDSIDVTEWQSKNNLLDVHAEECLMYQYTGGEDDTEESTCNTLDTAIGNGCVTENIRDYQRQDKAQ